MFGSKKLREWKLKKENKRKKQVEENKKKDLK